MFTVLENGQIKTDNANEAIELSNKMKSRRKTAELQLFVPEVSDAHEDVDAGSNDTQLIDIITPDNPAPTQSVDVQQRAKHSREKKRLPIFYIINGIKFTVRSKIWVDFYKEIGLAFYNEVDKIKFENAIRELDLHLQPAARRPQSASIMVYDVFVNTDAASNLMVNKFKKLAKKLKIQFSIIMPKFNTKTKNKAKKQKTPLPKTYNMEGVLYTINNKTWYELAKEILIKLYYHNTNKFKEIVHILRLDIKKPYHLKPNPSASSQLVIDGFFINTLASANLSMDRLERIGEFVGNPVSFQF